MKIVNSLDSLELEQDFALTIGNFDGVHIAHQQLLKSIQEDCKKSSLELVVLTFTPHPSFVLSPRSDFLILNYDQRRAILEENGVNYLYEMPFTRDFSTVAPENFVTDYLLNNKKLKKIYVGHDFAFGANKKGSYELLKSLCLKENVEVNQCQKFLNNDLLVSSSLVRENIKNGEIETVSNLLGRDFKLKGAVIKGEGRGKQIGFPTANVSVGKEFIRPKNGVYITTSKLRDMTFHSVTNIGSNPTFKDDSIISIETHILDFDQDIYGEVLEVSFLKKLRDEIKFESVNQLIEEIKKNVDQTREYFQK